jgi:hypothetical protein
MGIEAEPVGAVDVGWEGYVGELGVGAGLLGRGGEGVGGWGFGFFLLQGQPLMLHIEHISRRQRTTASIIRDITALGLLGSDLALQVLRDGGHTSLHSKVS